jgi:hypothetical protein
VCNRILEQYARQKHGVLYVLQGNRTLECVSYFPTVLHTVLFFGMISCLFDVYQAQNSEDFPVKQYRRAVSVTWVSSFTFVTLVLLLLIIGGGVSASKLRSWYKYPDLNPWSIGKPSPRDSHKMVTGSDGALWSFGGISITRRHSNELFKLDLEIKHWTTITTSGVSPSPRSLHSMGSTDGFLWVFGGETTSGEG